MWENWLERRNNYRTAVCVACAAVEGAEKEGRRRVRLVNRPEGWVPILGARTPASGKTSNIHRQPFCASFFFRLSELSKEGRKGSQSGSEHTCTYACGGRMVELPFFLPTRGCARTCAKLPHSVRLSSFSTIERSREREDYLAASIPLDRFCACA